MAEVLEGEAQPQQEKRLERLRAAVGLTTHDICTEVGTQREVQFSPEVVAILSELTMDKISRVGEDLEAFAQHGKRCAITGDDVKLLTRRNPELTAYMASLQREPPVLGPNKPKQKAAKKKKEEKQIANTATAQPILID